MSDHVAWVHRIDGIVSDRHISPPRVTMPTPCPPRRSRIPSPQRSAYSADEFLMFQKPYGNMHTGRRVGVVAAVLTTTAWFSRHSNTGTDRTVRQSQPHLFRLSPDIRHRYAAQAATRRRFRSCNRIGDPLSVRSIPVIPVQGGDGARLTPRRPRSAVSGASTIEKSLELNGDPRNGHSHNRRGRMPRSTAGSAARRAQTARPQRRPLP
ncbi:MAG: hypothetical protein V8T87_12865 [Victivallales bacterium]